MAERRSLQECGVVHMASLAQRFSLAGDLLQSVIEPRVGHSIKGRLQAGLLFTPAYISRIKAQVRPQLSSVLTALWTSMHGIASDSMLDQTQRDHQVRQCYTVDDMSWPDHRSNIVSE